MTCTLRVLLTFGIGQFLSAQSVEQEAFPIERAENASFCREGFGECIRAETARSQQCAGLRHAGNLLLRVRRGEVLRCFGNLLLRLSDKPRDHGTVPDQPLG
jgi:hypothetical protein